MLMFLLGAGFALLLVVACFAAASVHPNNNPGRPHRVDFNLKYGPATNVFMTKKNRIEKTVNNVWEDREQYHKEYRNRLFNAIPRVKSKNGE